MSRKTICLLLLAAFINSLFSGCTQVVRRSVNDLAEQQRQKEGNDTIVGVDLKDGTVTFDSLGGLFDRRTNTVAGFTADSEPIRLGFDAITQVRVRPANAPADSLDTLATGKLPYRFTESYLEPILKLKLENSDSLVEFTGGNGWIHPGHRVVCGPVKSPALLQYPFDDIQYAMVVRPDPGKTHTLLVVTGICVAVVLLVILIDAYNDLWNEQWDWHSN